STYVQIGCSWEATEISESDPNLKDPANLDFGLSTGSSACINKGNNAAMNPYNITTDINGLSRIFIGIKANGDLDMTETVDIGADEYQPLYVPASFSTIAAALLEAQNNDFIIVTPGTYKEHLNFNGRNIKLRSDLDGKKSTANDQVPLQTFLDGDQTGRVLVFNSGESAAAVVDGFTITHGASTNGAGVYCTNSSSPTIEDSIIVDNHATGYGGGICCTAGGKLTITNTVIKENSAAIGGGGYYILDSNSQSSIKTCEFMNNWAGVHGGAFGSTNGWATIQDNKFHNNTAPRGGAIYMAAASPNVQGNFIYDNGNPTSFDIQAGGGICIEANSDAKLQKNLIYQNYAVKGGGIYCDASNSMTMENNNLYKNIADYGGGMYFSATEETLTCNTLFGNKANFEGGGYYIINAPAASNVVNSILWANTAPVGAAIQFVNGEILVSHCNISEGSTYSWFDATNSISYHPTWQNDNNPTSTISFLRLKENSPCINMGSDSFAANKDIDDTKRPTYGTTDMGSHEFQYKNYYKFYPGLSTDLPDIAHYIFVIQPQYEPVEFTLDAGSGNAGREYFLLASLSGTTPGMGGLPNGEFLPLNWDFMTNLTVSACIFGSPIFVDFHGNLDANGTAKAYLEYGGLLTLDMVGIEISFAYMLRGGFSPWNYASNPIRILIKREEA
ncbi:MAG: right-handed parallel beta-helix repeat-containing protein, partial [Planctomycetota bacterium]